MASPDDIASTALATPEQIEALRTALSAAFGAELADEFNQSFLHQLARTMDPADAGMAVTWGWNDTEVREKACATAAQMLGLAPSELSPESAAAAAAAYTRWARDNGHPSN